MTQSEQMPTTGEFEEMQVHTAVQVVHIPYFNRCMYMYVHHICIFFLFTAQADLAFKKEEKEKSEATAKTLELGKLVFLTLAMQ